VLTELEGGILSEIHHRGEQTAFQVRRSFALSPSLEWRGSAGAVYAAIKRLEGRGLIQATAKGDGRGARLLSVTDEGKAEMFAWACDPTRATSVGIDPFRMRAGIWEGLDRERRGEVIAEVRKALAASLEIHRAFSRNKDAIERASIDLAMRLQKARLEWLEEVAARDDAAG
jgi:DNA-binding PadR family transcriptional regulator